MKTEEDEAFDDLAKKQGDWGGGFPAKRAMAADRFKDGIEWWMDTKTYGAYPNPPQWHIDTGNLVRLVPQPVQQEAIYGMNQDDWKDVVAAISKVRDSRGIYLGCRPADVFQDWFLALGTAKVKEKNNG
jgi:hypothetical protein